MRFASALAGPKRDIGGRTIVRSTIDGFPLPSRVETRASPTPKSVITSSTSNFGFSRYVSAAARIAFCCFGVKERNACCTRFPNCPNTLSGISEGFWVIKKIPTPLERIRRTTCSTFSSNALGASLNNKCASSKKNTNFGFSASPASGNSSNNSDNIHNKNVAYKRGLCISLSEAKILTMPLPSISVRIKSRKSNAGSPKKWLPPWSSNLNKER